MTENFPSFIKNINPHIHDIQETPRRTNIKDTDLEICSHIKKMKTKESKTNKTMTKLVAM
jgi:hypothetical protein